MCIHVTSSHCYTLLAITVVWNILLLCDQEIFCCLKINFLFHWHFIAIITSLHVCALSKVNFFIFFFLIRVLSSLNFVILFPLNYSPNKALSRHIALDGNLILCEYLRIEWRNSVWLPQSLTMQWKRRNVEKKIVNSMTRRFNVLRECFLAMFLIHRKKSSWFWWIFNNQPLSLLSMAYWKKKF